MTNGLEPDKASLVVDHRAHSRVWAGVVLILVGALFFIDRLGWDMGWAWRPTFARMWPVLLIVAGLSPRPPSNLRRFRARRLDGNGWRIPDRSGQIARIGLLL